MRRNTSVTTRIHQPPAPPCWFRTIFYISFGAWVVLQSATEYYTIMSLHTYTHLPLFENEKQVDSAFLNILAVGILTACLVLSFIYGIAIVSKLVVLASAAFLATLLILNILAVGILMASRFSLAIGPVKLGLRVVTINHHNVSAAHWYSEMDHWAALYPLKPSTAVTDAGNVTAATPPAAASAGTGAAASAATASEAKAREAGNVTAAGGGGGEGGSGGGAPPGGTTPPANATAAVIGDSRLWPIWQAENGVLPLLSFFQRKAYCCGVKSAADYATHGAQTPVSCRCRDDIDESQQVWSPCSPTAHRLVDGVARAVWVRGCQQVLRSFLRDLFYLRDLLAATVIFQFVVMLLGVVLGLNMPDSKGDDSDDEGGDY